MEIGVGALPSPSPAAPRYSNWFPVVHRPPEVPPVDEVTPNPVADGVLLEWPAVDLAGVVYVVERGPSPEGPWTEIYRTTDTRYFYSDNTGTKWWFKITPTVRGRPGSGSVVEATPPPTTAELIEQTERITKEIADRIEADAAEAAARADGLAAAARDLLAEADLRQRGVFDAMEAIAQEAQARADGLLNERLEREAAITLETQTRQSDVESLSRALSEVAAGSGTQFDSLRIWYFDTTVEEWTGNGSPPTVVDGWLRPANGTENPYVQSPAALGVDGSAYRFVKLRVKRVGGAAWDGFLQWITLADQAWDVDKRAAIPEPRWDDNGVGTVDVADIAWWPGEVDAIRLQFGGTQTVSSYFMTDWVAIGRPTPGAGVALVQEEARARVAADVAEASKRETLAVQLRGDYQGSDLSQVPSGLFAAERDARVTADEANASAIDVIQARLPTGDGTVATEASITEERQARADGDSANAEAIERVSARMPAGDGKVASAEALDAVSTRVEETEEGIRAVGDRTSSLEAQVTYKHAGDRDWNAGDRDVRAGVKTWQSVIAQGDRAVAKQVESVRAELGDFEATATRSIEVIATEQSAQAVQIQHLGVELDGKASADYVEEISARVDVTEQGIEAFTGQLQSVKAEVDSKASAQVVEGMEARVVQTENGLTQVLARAFLNVIANSGGGPLIGGMVIENNGQVVNTRFSSNTFEVISPGASEGMEWRGGFLRVWKGSAQRIIGTNFGAAGDNLVDYFGPNVGAGAASKANAVMWMDANGSAYFGGQLSAGILRNAVQTTTTQTVGVELVNGPFATNGRVRSVTVSFSRRHVRTKTTYGTDGFVAGAGQNTARVEIYRRVGEGAESLWQVLNASGGVNILNETDGPDNAISDWGGSFTVNDTSPSAQTMTYRAVITSFTEQSVTHTSGSFQQQSITQSLSIISVEN
ncbi:hypothetical protein [Stenotrophomonas sp. Ps181]|uniref:hypothetical protein n=1 Tax=Stenotrophomonas sp. Ps181 TaxID=2859892 RepID=UPI0021E15CD9|nr:hypothetical protein [Stenotrophomonas sp. Ps181]MCV0219821.1 hypothetical protein [Stenotrophomonas sp. Ps181]